MSIQSICRYTCILIISWIPAIVPAQAVAQADTAVADTVAPRKERKPETGGHQVCIGFDFFHPVINQFLKDRYAYEIAADYYYRDEYYLIAEGGWGGATVNYPDLKYSTANTFLRAGFNKSILTRTKPDDWDIMFIGFRAAMSSISRSSASYVVIDSVWGNSSGAVASRSLIAAWAEITGGMRVEFIRGLSVGWNARGKFLINGKSKSFQELAPLYIAGYGKGDKNSIFDFNAYVSYAIRWKRESALQAIKLIEEKKKREEE